MKLADGITHKHNLNSFMTLPERFTKVHGSKYDYSKVVFVNGDAPVEILCPYHGSFLQTPRSHSKGSSCPACVNTIRGRNSRKYHTGNRISTAEWVKKATLVHGDKYDYSLTEYTGASNKVIFNCFMHGEVAQVATSHLNGHGCFKCANILTTRQFIAKAGLIHKGKYFYAKTLYKNHNLVVTITCPVHGDFEQEAHTHLRGHGCQKCATRGFKKELPGVLYYFKIQHNSKEYYKIGITNKDLNSRYTKKELVNCTILYEEPFTSGFDAYYLELLILNSNKGSRANLCILKTGNTEIFKEGIFDYTQRKYHEIYKTNTCIS